MLGYFTRRIIRGLITLFILSLLLHRCLYYFTGTLPGAAVGNEGDEWKPDLGSLDYVIRDFDLEKPWPISYFAWLFDPEDTLTSITYDLEGNPIPQVPIGIDISIGHLQIKGSGVVTGDLGPSMYVGFYTPLSDIFGPGISEMFLLLASLTAMLMLVVSAQRWRRPQPYRASTLPTSSALVTWWQLHSRSPLDMAIMDRQWA